jgi:hypothetical protein
MHVILCLKLEIASHFSSKNEKVLKIKKIVKISKIIILEPDVISFKIKITFGTEETSFKLNLKTKIVFKK